MRPTAWLGCALLLLVGLAGVITGILPDGWLPYDVVADVSPADAGLAPSAAHWVSVM